MRTSWIAGWTLIGSLSLIVPAPAEDAAPAAAWETDCSTIAGWHYNIDNAGFNTEVTQPEPSVIKITQKGSETWGKAAYVVQGVDLDATPILEVKATKVDVGSAFSVAVASKDWMQMFTVIQRTSADGVHTGNIKDAIKESKDPDAWKAPATINVVIVVEGKDKSTYLDSVKIRAEK